MEIVKVKREEIIYFSGLAPVEALGILTLPNAAAIGAVEGKDAAGLLIFTRQGKESITIEWLYVDEKFRGMGAGSMLMEKIFDIAEKLRVKRVCARLNQDENFEACQLYLIQWGFSWMQTLPGEWNLTAKELFSLPFARKVLKMDADVPDILPLSEINKKDLAKAVKEAEKEGTSILYDVAGDYKSLDPNMSVVYSKGGKICGMFLIHRKGGILYPAALWAKDMDQAIISALFAGCLKSGSKNLKDKDTIRITATSTGLYDFEKKLLSGISEKTVYMMQAPSDMLKKAEQEPVSIKDLFMPKDIPTSGFAAVDFEVR